MMSRQGYEREEQRLRMLRCSTDGRLEKIEGDIKIVEFDPARAPSAKEMMGRKGGR